MHVQDNVRTCNRGVVIFREEDQGTLHYYECYNPPELVDNYLVNSCRLRSGKLVRYSLRVCAYDMVISSSMKLKVWTYPLGYHCRLSEDVSDSLRLVATALLSLVGSAGM